MKTIIVPIDLSESSKKIIKLAIGLAKKINAKIIFSYAHNVIYASHSVADLSLSRTPVAPNIIAQQRLAKESTKDFMDSIKTLDGMSSIKYRTHVGVGTQELVISNLIEKENADLVVMGSHYETDIERLLLGSMDEKITREALCSVLVLPENLKSVKFNKVTLALDTDWFENETQMNMLFLILKIDNAKLDIIHVTDDEKNKLKETQLIEKYALALKDLDYSFHVIYNKNSKDSILQFLNKQSADILAIIYREHGFLKRLFDPGIRKEMIADLKIPLFIIK